MGFVAPLMIAGAAMAAAGTAANMVDAKKKQKDIRRIEQNAQGKVDRNSAEAMQAWNQALDKMSIEKQDALTTENADKRMDAFEKNTADVPEATNVMQTGGGAPAVVKTTAARQLGDKLAEMKSMMQARSRLGGWDDRGIQSNIMLNRTGQQIGQLADFSKGSMSAAQQMMQERAAKKNMLGDILMAGGSLAMMGGGLAGGAGAAAASTAASGASQIGTKMIQAGPMGTPVQAPVFQQPGMVERGWNWLTTPIKFG